MRVRIRRAWYLAIVTLATSLSIAPVAAAPATPWQAFVTVAASDLGGATYATSIGGLTFMDVTIRFENIAAFEGANPTGPFDIYVGATLPDGRFRSWVGPPLGSEFVTGPTPVPLLAGIVPEVGTYHAFRWIQFPDGSPPGWYVLYGIVVSAGANPLDPREWAGWRPASFHPLRVTP